jgi:hypothetical protein
MVKKEGDSVEERQIIKGQKKGCGCGGKKVERMVDEGALPPSATTAQREQVAAQKPGKIVWKARR